MKCPIDNATLLITERQGIEIDYCPECRGVWLDRGELDKLISTDLFQPSQNQQKEEPRRQHNDYYTDDYHGDHHKKKRRKESFLGDLFDF